MTCLKPNPRGTTPCSHRAYRAGDAPPSAYRNRVTPAPCARAVRRHGAGAARPRGMQGRGTRLAHPSSWRHRESDAGHRRSARRDRPMPRDGRHHTPVFSQGFTEITMASRNEKEKPLDLTVTFVGLDDGQQPPRFAAYKVDV